jgi:hypothetical protein
MITLGGSCPWRLGVPGPPALGEPPPTLNRSGATILAPGFNEFIEPDCGCRAGLAALFTAPSFGGRGLFRGSVRVVVEEEGVATGDWPASRDAFDCEGEEVPSFDSLFLDLDDLLGSFARESCSCCRSQRVDKATKTLGGAENSGRNK